mmetsp:Transcript_11359/g.34762  ORF Transcript_11359/g.34762 Transcript_11359/m.34762 type:complete len:223 (-) Transcript_11359:117-785(-)|eukprot:CAMPEP_0198736410 /NCGR_PEP_ID=MMETSP1475-20131203/65516_1 /TAXON_ID= ORGANISM="Unidentified sp., Strain CCMP1999" /NCGR_SAMPLE_ID=MMETSP1475 /ASSEMBLY_ACC=CAM_ASM_001111 /LENGTH=222 /DNA_ID=CAMNT_0044500215 /DNA_START=112 /DNA_END=780 /DNA_ORIENTATION=+
MDGRPCGFVQGLPTSHRARARQSRTALSERDSLLQLSRSTKRGTTAKLDEQKQVEAIITELVRKSRCNDGVEAVRAPLKSELLRGRWDLQYSTETVLVDLMRKGLPFLLKPATEVYQTVAGGLNGADDGLIQNVVEFPRPRGSLKLVVGVEFDASQDFRCNFVFRKTALDFPGRTVNLPFAIGRGYFDILFFDGQLRIDRDQRGWINIYTYAGPVERCSFEP